MDRPTRLTKSLILATVAFLLGQTALLSLIAIAKGIAARYFVSFYPVTAGVHGLLLALVLVRRSDFQIVGTERRLERVNIPNLLSMFRISTTPTILYLLTMSVHYSLIAPIVTLVTLAFVSDFLDGRISRRLGEVTKIGMYLDSMSDYAILIAVSIAFAFFRLVGLWFFVIVLVRLGFQFFGMASLLVYHGHVKTGSNLIGKASVFATMVVFAVATLGLVRALAPAIHVVVTVLEIVCAVILVISTGEKAWSLVREFRLAASIRKQQPQQ